MNTEDSIQIRLFTLDVIKPHARGVFCLWIKIDAHSPSSNIKTEEAALAHIRMDVWIMFLKEWVYLDMFNFTIYKLIILF